MYKESLFLGSFLLGDFCGDDSLIESGARCQTRTGMAAMAEGF